LNYSSSNRGFPAGTPIANALVVIVGALAIAASVVLGFFALIVLASLVLVFAAIIGIRVWWFRRKFQRARRSAEPDRGTQNVIEGEFRVVDPEKRKEPR
jgi:membrane protein implicated in regulation of membrane protease activity